MNSTEHQLTQFQRNKITRDKKIYAIYSNAVAKTTAVQSIAKDYKLTISAVWKIVKTQRELHHV